jgi:PAS domain S-box-containing protein
MKLFSQTSRVPLRIKLIVLFVGIALVPLLIVALVTTTRLQETQRQNALTHANQIAATTREEIKTFVTSQFSILESIQAIYPFLSVQQREDYIEQILFLSGTFTDLAILNAEGRETVRKNRIEVVNQDDLRDQSATSKFRNTRENGAYIGPLYLVNGKPFFTLAINLRAVNGSFQGVASAEVDARILQDVIRKISVVEESGRAYIVNPQGIAVAHPDISIVLAGTDLSALPPVQELLTGTPRDPLENYVNDEQKEVIGTAIPIDITVGTLGTQVTLETHWTIITEQEASVALKTVRELQQLELLLLSLSLFGSTIAAIFVASNIVKPISTILYGLQQFGQNNLRYRVEVTSNDETRDLADGFNRMAENLGKSVAELKEEREAIAVERNKLALVLSGISDAVVSIDLSGSIITFNSAAEELLDYPSKEAVGRKVDEVVIIKTGRQIIGFKRYSPSADDGGSEPFHNDMVTVVRPDGRTATASMLVTVLAASPHVNIGWIITLHDRTKEQAVESIKREFVSIAAHQLRTPLTAIKWATDMFLNGYAGKPSTEQKSLIEKAHLSTDRMIMLVNDLLNTARLEEGRLVAERRPTDMVQLVKTVIDNAKASVAKKEHTVTFTPPERPVPLLVLDNETMALALQNLLENAIRYTKAHGHITVTMTAEDSKLAIIVADTGVGVPEDQKDRLFSKFFRGKNVMNLETEGSGLGLFIAKNIVETHGGQLLLASKEGEGTTVTITLPLSSVDRSTLPTPSPVTPTKKTASSAV